MSVPAVQQGTVAATERNLHEIADSIWESIEQGKQSAMQALDAQLAIGRDLVDARTRFPSDNDFGDWFAGQNFPFGRSWAWTLRAAAENEKAVRQAVVTQVTTGAQPNLKKALAEVRRPRLVAVTEAPQIEYVTAAWVDLAGLMESIESTLSRDPAELAAAVPLRRRAATAKKLRKLGTRLGRIAWTLEGMEIPSDDAV